MKRAAVVIGAGFGDEGKGLMTDFFCGRFAAKGTVLNVRFNGGAQAGHTVVTPQGRRHVFSHIGAGSFHSGVMTYFAPRTVLNPMLLLREAGPGAPFEAERLLLDRDCAVTVPWDMMLNQFAERHRGRERHGSCGLGIFETVVRNRDPRFALRTADIAAGPEGLKEKLRDIRESYVPRRLRELDIGPLTEEENSLLADENIMMNFVQDAEETGRRCRITDPGILDEYDAAVFEGAQGLLLDWDRRDYYPHITASHTGMKNVSELLRTRPPEETELCYVTRSYMTRHGAGRFDTECEADRIAKGMTDLTNRANEFQGSFRYGFFDPEQFRRVIGEDLRYADAGMKVTVSVTHLDETDGKFVLRDGEKADPEELIKALGLRPGYRSKGPVRDAVRCL